MLSVPRRTSAGACRILEDLVNLAGETFYFPWRVQQVSDLLTLGEMEATIDRVRDQLRRLDTELKRKS